MESNELPGKIRDLRAKYGLTLEQVAQQVGVGKSTVRKWETGIIENMRRDKIAKLAEALHTTPGYLMGWEDSPAASGQVDPLSPATSTLSLTVQEESIVLAYRAADPLDKALVRRVLQVDLSESEEAENVG